MWKYPSSTIDCKWPHLSVEQAVAVSGYILATSSMKEDWLERRNAPQTWKQTPLRAKIWNTVELQGASIVRWMQKEPKDPSWPFDQQRGSPVAGCWHFEQAITLAWRRPVSHHRQSRGEVIGRPIARNGCLVYIFIPNIDQRFDDCVSREFKHSHVSWPNAKVNLGCEYVGRKRSESFEYMTGHLPWLRLRACPTEHGERVKRPSRMLLWRGGSSCRIQRKQ